MAGRPTLGNVGGTGALGTGRAKRWAAETLTSILVGITRRSRAGHAGIRIAGPLVR